MKPLRVSTSALTWLESLYTLAGWSETLSPSNEGMFLGEEALGIWRSCKAPDWNSRHVGQLVVVHKPRTQARLEGQPWG